MSTTNNNINNLDNDQSKNNDSNHQTTKRPFLENDKFEKLKDSQQRIFLATDLSPSIRKLLNLLVTDEAVNNIENEFIEKYKY